MVAWKSVCSILSNFAIKEAVVVALFPAAASVLAQVATPLSFHVTESQILKLNAQIARVVWYRPVSDHPGQPMRIMVNDAYQGSLYPGSFTELCGPARAIKVAVSNLERREETLMNIAGGQTLYIRLSPHAEQKNIWQSVSGLQALQEAAQAMPSMTHTRVPQAQSCQSE